MWYLHPGSGVFTRLKETLHWHILPEPAREVRTLKPRMNSIAKPSWPPGDNCWSLGARGAPDQVNFLPGDTTSKSHSGVKKDIPFLQMLYKCLGRRPIRWICLPMLKHIVLCGFLFFFCPAVPQLWPEHWEAKPFNAWNAILKKRNKLFSQGSGFFAFREGNPRTLNIAIIGVAASQCWPGVLKPAIAAIRIHRSCCCDSGCSGTLVHPERQ